MSVGSGLPLCLAGIDIFHQARCVRQSKSGSTNGSSIAAEDGSSNTAEEWRAGDRTDSCSIDSETETRKNVFRNELAKEMEVLDRRREALKEQQRSRLDEQLRRVRAAIESRVRESLDHVHQSRGARAA